MHQDVNWLFGVGGLLVVNIWILWEFEFRVRFERRVFGLRPGDFRKPEFTNLLGDILDPATIFKAQLTYVGISIFALLLVSGFVNCVEPVRDVVRGLFPSFLFDFIDKFYDKSNYSRSFFYNVMFFSVLFHSLPFISTIFDPNNEKGDWNKSSIDEKVMRILTIFFSAQQYFLERTISRLLRDQPGGRGLAESNGEGSLTGRVRSRIAEALSLEIELKDLRDEYVSAFCGDQYRNRSNQGIGVAAVKNESQKLPSPHNMATKFIDKFGIPDLQSRFKWRKNRNEIRKVVAQDVRVIIDGEKVEDAWMENIGKCIGIHKKWKSVLFTFNNPGPGLISASNRNTLLFLTHIGEKQLPEKIKFKIIRRVNGRRNGDELLYIGAVVVEDNRKTLPKQLKMASVG